MFTAFRIFAVMVMLVAASAMAATTTYFTPLGLTGGQEVPATGSPATGFGIAVFDDVALTLSVTLTWQDLLSVPPTAAHIHCCPGPGVNGPVAIDFVPAGFPTMPGIFNGVFDLTAAASYGGGFLKGFGGDVDAARAAVIAGLNAGQAYFNIHNEMFTGGEIRGDIVVTPEPTSLTLIGLGVLTLALRVRSVRSS